MKGDGFIKIDRSILNWGWFTDGNTFRVFMYLLLIANYKDGEFMGEAVPRGSCVCSYPGISLTLKISVQEARTAIKHLKSTGEITVRKTSKFSVISIKNYDKFQSANSLSNSQLTVNQQSANSQLTPSKKERKKECKNNNIYSNGGASYDIEKAVLSANTTVPTVTKRSVKSDS